MEQVLSSEPTTPWGCSTHLHPLSPLPTMGQQDYSSPRGEPSSQQASGSPAVCLYESTLQKSLSGPNMDHSDEACVVLLNEHNNRVLRTLTLAIFQNRITGELQCNNWLANIWTLRRHVKCGF